MLTRIVAQSLQCRWLFLSLALLLPAGAAPTEEELPKITTRYYILPHEMFLTANTDDPDGIPKALKGKQLTLPADGNGATYDVRQILQDQGIPYVKGSEAIYFYDKQLLVMRDSEENIGLMDALSSDVCGQQSKQLVSEFVVGTFTLPSGEEIHQPIPYSVFMKRVGDTWKVENQLGIPSQSGSKAKGANRQARLESNPRDSSAVKPAAKSDLSAEVEVQVGPDGVTIDTMYNFTFQGKLGSGDDVDISLESHASLWNGYSTIIYLSQLPSNDGAQKKNSRQRYVAVILKSTMSNPGGWVIKPN